jgi:transcriptional regulator with XRE-family HTH domain
MAGVLGISRPTLTRLENADQNMTLKTLAQLCRALRCEPWDLFEPGNLRWPPAAGVGRPVDITTPQVDKRAA